MERIKQALDKFLAIVCISLFGFLVLLVTWQVFTRFILNNPSATSEELARYCFVWLVLFGSAFVFGENGHLAITFIKDKFNGNIKIWLEVFIELVNMTFAILVLLIGGYIASELAWGQLSASLQIPVGYLYASLPISGFFTIFYCSYNIYKIIKTKKPLEEI